VLGGQAQGVEPSDIKHDLFDGRDEYLNSEQIEFFIDVGARLGRFFANLHAPQTTSKILDQYSPEHFQIPEIRQVVIDLAIKPVAGLLKLFPDLIGDQEATELGEILVQEFLRETTDEERSFILGDSWTGAVLTSNTTAQSDTNPRIVGVIDWEFATFGRGVNGDMSQFLAHFSLLKVAAMQDPRFLKQAEAVRLMIKSITASYSQTAQNLIPNDGNTTRPSLSWDPPDPNSLHTRRMRSTFLSHGAEMINVSFWKHWNCVSADCPKGENGTHTKILHHCVLIQRMVAEGLWFLRHARADIEAFCSNQNWEEIRSEEGRGRVLLGLF
jgi:hypothetical protein